MKRRNHSRELKLEVCRQIASGERRPAQVCREHELSPSLLMRWRKEYERRVR
jgi:putative transposase